MKIDQIKATLDAISKEDENALTEIKEELQKYDQIINELECSLDDINNQEARMAIISEIRTNVSKKLEIILTMIEKIGGVGIILFAIVASLPIMPTIIILALGFGLTTKGVCDYQRIFSPFMKKNMFLSYLAMFKELLKDKDVFKSEINRINALSEDITAQLSSNQRSRDSLSTRAESIKDELSFIEGNLIAVDTLNNKYKIEELSDNVELVSYVTDYDRRLRLKN